MATPTVLTFAELEYLMSTADAWPSIRSQLGIQPAESITDVSAAGLASLLVRQLAQLDGDSVVVNDEVLALTNALGADHDWITIACVPSGAPSAGYSLHSPRDGSRLLVVLAAPGCYEFANLTADIEVGAQVSAILLGFLDTSGPAAAVARAKSDAGEVGLVCGRDSSGNWYLDDGGEALPATREELQDRLTGLFQTTFSVAGG